MRRAAIPAVLAALAALFLAQRDAGEATAGTVADPVVAAAGDIACDPTSSSFNGGLGTSSRCRQRYTSDLLVNAGLTAVLALGDNQYECAGGKAFLQSYDASWGRVKSITRPIAGDNEYDTTGGMDCDATGRARGHFGYFGAPAGDPDKGYYSFDIGDWHIVALNSSCSKVGGCAAGSPQEKWLRADLAAHPAACTMALTHTPRFSSTDSNQNVRPLWDALFAAGAEVVLSGHQHNYERFAPQTPSGGAHPEGVRQFVVGTGGKSLFSFSSARANSQVRGVAYGVLRLTLHPASYEWRFVPAAGATFTDSGGATCHGLETDDTTPPAAPANLSARAVDAGHVELAWTAATDDVGVVAYDIERNGARIATTGPQTTFVDDSVASEATYTYRVAARDAAGNTSPPSPPASVTTPAGTPPATLTFAPEADARVEESAPAANFGGGYLSTEAGTDPDVETLLRFTVGGVVGTVGRAVVRLYASNGTWNGPAIYGTGGGWSEGGVTWSTRPARATAALDDKGPVGAATWVELDVTQLVRGDGTYHFMLAQTVSDAMDAYSREATSLRPELVLTLG